MKCLVCETEFDYSKPLETDLFVAMGIGPVEAETLARRKRSSEQNSWQFVKVTLSDVSVLEGHVCPAHANADSISLSKGLVK